jgi:hypothetical protein
MRIVLLQKEKQGYLKENNNPSEEEFLGFAELRDRLVKLETSFHNYY